MKTIKSIKFTAALIIICLVTLTGLNIVSAGVNTVNEFKGKVIYEDDGSNVSGGVIEVFLYSNDDDPESLIEKVTVNSKGEFTLSKINGIQSDRIKIMCYPNDLDNFNTGFSVKEVKLSEANTNIDRSYDIIIEVKRSVKNERQD